jgi:Tfp pilus assembly ATPase PilU
MQTGKQQGMIMFDDSLRTLIDAGHITGEEAYSRAKNKASFKQYIAEKEAPADAPKAAEAPKPAGPPAPPAPSRRV